MTIAAAIENRMAEASRSSTPSRIGRIDILHELGPAEKIWRSLQEQPHLSTPFQRFEFVEAWLRHVGVREGFSPFIVIAYDVENRPLAVLPLASRWKHGIRAASFMGGKHSTFNMGLWSRDFAGSATTADVDALRSSIAAQSDADVLALNRQPLRWRGMPNPMALLTNQASADGCPLLTIMPGETADTLTGDSLRRQLNKKERKLQSLSGYRYLLASTDADINRLLDWFFCTKPLRMAEQRLPNVFADPGVEEFIRNSCLARLPGGGHVINIHALECDEEVLTVFAGVADGTRFSSMINTYTISGNSRHSPGMLLIRKIVEDYAGLGYGAIDFGVGLDEYKRQFCKSDEPIFDSFVPLSPRGSIAATAMSFMVSAKRLVKHNQPLFNMARKLRSSLRQ